MKIDSQYLYDLLPAYYRLLDSDQGEPLKALVEVLAREAGIVEEDITRLYENWFIETCDEWVVPYIGDLLGVRGMHEIDDKAVYSRRAYVANTLSYRRRKGTAPVLEQLALDITGWRSRVVEFFQLLTATQHLNHLRLHATATPDLRQMNQLDLLNTPFDSLSHTVDVRRIAAGLGKYNIKNIGLYIWRLQSYPLDGVDAHKVAGAPDGCYTFSPLGLDTQLFNRPQTEREIIHLAEEINIPGPLRRRGLFDELENRRRAQVNEVNPTYEYFDDRPTANYPPVFELFLDGDVVLPEEITICNLTEWRRPASTKSYQKQKEDGTYLSVSQAIKAAVDPKLGRIALADSTPDLPLTVSYSYGFSGDIGGGPYDRRESLAALPELPIDWHVGVSKDHAPAQTEPIYETLSEAIDAWNGLSAAKTGLITIMDNRTYAEDLTGLHRIIIPAGRQLFLLAADWPEVGPPGEKYRKPGLFNPEDVRPHLLGNIEVAGTADPDSPDGGALVMNGLLIEGKVTILGKPTISAGNLQSCTLSHCTLVPGKGGLEVEQQTRIIGISLERSICGPVRVSSEDARVSIQASIIDHPGGPAIDAEKCQLDIQESTVFGTVTAQTLEAGNSIFNDLLDITRRQAGCVRFSYLPQGSRTPRRFHCQPEWEIQAQVKDKEAEKKAKLTAGEKQAIEDQVIGWLFPVFNATEYGRHAYCQLGSATPRQITAGAENAAEMGVFNHLQQPQRAANLRIALAEYLPLGLEAGILFVT